MGTVPETFAVQPSIGNEITQEIPESEPVATDAAVKLVESAQFEFAVNPAAPRHEPNANRPEPRYAGAV